MRGDLERLIGDFGDQAALILRDHGLLTVGETAAPLRMYYPEKAARRG